MECKRTEKGEDYRGTISVTRLGYICQRWDMQIPHTHVRTDPAMFEETYLSDIHNYCRNPLIGIYQDSPYCITTNPDVRLDFCDIPDCGQFS